MSKIDYSDAMHKAVVDVRRLCDDMESLIELLDSKFISDSEFNDRYALIQTERETAMFLIFTFVEHQVIVHERP